MSTIVFIGLGRMGVPMAAHLVAAGHTVRGVEINPAAADAARAHGIEVVDSVAAALPGADACLTSLPKPASRLAAMTCSADGASTPSGETRRP